MLIQKILYYFDFFAMNIALHADMAIKMNYYY